MLYGYARVSTVGQSVGAQIETLKAAGCAKVFHEKMTGTRADRPQLRKLMKVIGSGDMLVVTQLDRLARSTLDLLRVLEEVKQVGAGFKSLGETWCDTTTDTGRFMLTIFGGLAEFERSLIVKRTSEGRARAMAAGVKFGREFKLTDHQQAEALKRLAAGEAHAVVARSYNLHRSTLYRLQDRAEAKAAVE